MILTCGFFVLFQCLKLCNRNLGVFLFSELYFPFQDICNEILCSKILMFLFSVNCMRECDRFLSNGSLVCPKSVHGFLMCLQDFSSGDIGKLGGNIFIIFFITESSQVNKMTRGYFWYCYSSVAPNQQAAFYRTLSFSVGGKKIQFVTLCSVVTWDEQSTLILYWDCVCTSPREKRVKQSV